MADLLIEQPTKFQLVIDGADSPSHRLTIPQSVLTAPRVRQRLAVLCTERTAKIHPPETFGRRSGNGCNGHYLPLPSIEASGRYGSASPFSTVSTIEMPAAPEPRRLLTPIFLTMKLSASRISCVGLK